MLGTPPRTEIGMSPAPAPYQASPTEFAVRIGKRSVGDPMQRYPSPKVKLLVVVPWNTSAETLGGIQPKPNVSVSLTVLAFPLAAMYAPSPVEFGHPLRPPFWPHGQATPEST